MPARYASDPPERTILDGPVTRRELERIHKRLREPPASELHLTPGGMMEQAIKRIQREDDAIRASFIDRSLKRMERRAEKSFERTFSRGRAQHDFERSR
jgi:hypothetical protein